MADNEWGLCKDCKWWQIEPKAAVQNLTMGLCIDEKLQRFLLRVSGNSDCNRCYRRHAKGIVAASHRCTTPSSGFVRLLSVRSATICSPCTIPIRYPPFDA